MSKSVHSFVIDHLEEVTNDIGGVIGYKLNLNADETDTLLRLIENEPLSQEATQGDTDCPN